MLNYGANTCFQKTGSFLCDSNSDEVQQTIRTLGLEACFSGKSGTAKYNGEHGGLCRAVYAFINSTDALTARFPKVETAREPPAPYASKATCASRVPVANFVLAGSGAL